AAGSNGSASSTISPISAKSTSNRTAAGPDCAPLPARPSTRSAAPSASPCRPSSRRCRPPPEPRLWCLKRRMARKPLIINVVQIQTEEVGLKWRRQLWHVLEHGRAVVCFRHRWEMIAAFWAALRQYCLFDVQIERLVLNVRASRADADQPGSLELKVRNDFLHDRAGAHRPFLGMLVVNIHVPVVQSLVTRPETDLVVPGRVLRMCPPS